MKYSKGKFRSDSLLTIGVKEVDGMVKSNIELRNRLKKLNIAQWELAEALGCSEGTLSRKMRYELNSEDKVKFDNAIISITSGKKDQPAEGYMDIKCKRNDVLRRIEELYQEIESLNDEHARLNRILIKMQQQVAYNQANKSVNTQKKEKRVKTEKGICSFCGGNLIYAKGLCRACYSRQRKNGTPEYKQKPPKTQKHKIKTDKTKLQKEAILKLWEKQGGSEISLFEAYSRFGERLTYRQRKVFYLRVCKGFTYRQAAESMSVSHECARQIEYTMMKRLKQSCIDIYNKEIQTIEPNINLGIPQEGIESLSNLLLMGIDEFIEETGISTRARNLLSRNGIKTVKGVLDAVFTGEILRLRNCGEKTAQEIESALKRYIEGVRGNEEKESRHSGRDQESAYGREKTAGADAGGSGEKVRDGAEKHIIQGKSRSDAQAE